VPRKVAVVGRDVQVLALAGTAGRGILPDHDAIAATRDMCLRRIELVLCSAATTGAVGSREPKYKGRECGPCASEVVVPVNGADVNPWSHSKSVELSEETTENVTTIGLGRRRPTRVSGFDIAKESRTLCVGFGLPGIVESHCLVDSPVIGAHSTWSN